MLFRAVSIFVLYAYSFRILPFLYDVPSLMFIRALSCFMFNALMFHSVCRSVLNTISGCMQIHAWYCSCLMLLHPLCCSMLYTASSVMLPNRLCYSILYAASRLMQIHAQCRSMLYAASCLMQIHDLCCFILYTSCYFMLYADLCFILIHAWFFSLAVSCVLLILRALLY